MKEERAKKGVYVKMQEKIRCLYDMVKDCTGGLHCEIREKCPHPPLQAKEAERSE